MNNSILNFLSIHKAQLAQIALVIMFISVLAWGASISTSSLNMIPEEESDLSLDGGEAPIPPELSPAVATTPVEFTPNQNETDGIIFAGVVLVLIIVVGTLGVIRQQD
jgi:septal ring-binding cell division protein DamX